MANTYKVLGQLNPSATTATTLYTVPAATSTVGSSLTICNQAATSATFRIAVRPAGATLATQHYLAYDTPLGASDSIAMTMGITMGNTDIITVSAFSGNVSFTAFGSELT